MTRADRVGEIIKREIDDIIRKKINDPRIGFISITRVEITDDLKFANVYVSVYADDEKKKLTMDGLNSARGFIRGLLGPHLDLKFVPDINFKLDNSIEKANRIFGIINRLKDEKKGKKRDGQRRRS